MPEATQRQEVGATKRKNINKSSSNRRKLFVLES
jgi:hypothetical protein